MLRARGPAPRTGRAAPGRSSELLIAWGRSFVFSGIARRWVVIFPLYGNRSTSLCTYI